MILFYLIIGIGFVLSLLVQGWLRTTYGHWSKVRNSKNWSGAKVARQVLDRNQMKEFQVNRQPGRLTDHYDPRTRTVNLSERIFREPSVASAAVAAHEAGHALQDLEGYGPMQLRYKMLPVAHLGAQYGPWVAIVGWMIGSTTMVQIGFLLFAAALVFQLLSLHIEVNASRRAKTQLEMLGFNTQKAREAARKVLLAAAMTYVAGAATAMGQILLILAFAGRGLLRKLLLKPKVPL